jgi:pectate lyase
MKRKVLFTCAMVLCYASIAYAVDGFATQNGGTTGGQGGTTITVDNAADFINYVQNQHQDPYIIYVSGHIDLGGSNIRVRGNKTIIGLPGSHITGNLKCYRSEESNNIFRYLDMDNYDKVGDGDCISLDGVSHIWIDHCTFTDAGDGAVDIKNGADYITVSWCKFQYTYVPVPNHNFTNLVGHDDDNGDTDMGHLRVTFHHNWYSTLCHERMPSVRFGSAHVYNTYFDCPGNRYCIRTRLYAQCLVENNYFKDVQNPWERYVTDAGGDPGLLYASGNILDNVTWYVGYDSQSVLIDGTDTVFTPPYAYTLDDAEATPAIVQYGAGADGQDGYPPHWFFGLYGDFDLSGSVDVNDLETFADYWLETENIDDADYYDNGRIDLGEFNLFANNYLYTPPDTTAPAAPDNLSALAGDNTVSLDWDDNDESDLDGYYVYRSTTSGSEYTKLNTLPLVDSDYTDDTVTNNTVYFYVVTAIDTSSNKSGNSSEASAVPIDANTIILQENETGFCGLDGIVDTGEHPGYTGYGYCDTENASGSGINWSINAVSAGTYTFTWRFANGSSDRPARLLINSAEEVSSINFPARGAWENWTEVSVQVTLTAGTKVVRLEATSGGGCANIDYLRIGGPAVIAAACP